MTEEEVPFEEEAPEVPEVPEVPEEETIPEPPALTRGKKDLKERVNCPDCGRQVSLHTLLHTHRCAAKKKREEAEAAPAPEPAPAPAPKKKVKIVEPKPALPASEVQKPLKQRSVIKRAERERAQVPEMPAYGSHFDEPQDLWGQLMQQRQMQSRMRAEAVASPYAQMFAQQRSRVM